jgi:transcriptional regulator with XRE-family HTH domain
LPFCHLKLTAEKPSYFPKIDNPVNLGDHLKNRRFELGFLQQKDVAKMLGVSPETVYNWEHNRSAPSLYQIPKVIQFLGYDPYTIKETLGGRIKRARQVLGMTQKELARKLGVDPGTLGKWERGERKPSNEMEEKATQLLNFFFLTPVSP